MYVCWFVGSNKISKLFIKLKHIMSCDSQWNRCGVSYVEHVSYYYALYLFSLVMICVLVESWYHWWQIILLLIHYWFTVWSSCQILYHQDVTLNYYRLQCQTCLLKGINYDVQCSSEIFIFHLYIIALIYKPKSMY